MKTIQCSVVLLVAASAITRSLATPRRAASYYAHNQGLTVVKRHEQPREEEEYVTSFYTRVRAKRRALFGRQLQQHEEQQQRLLHPRGDNTDHALDHYFDHHLVSSSRTAARPAPAPSTSSSAARCVRGGGGAAPRTTRPSSSSSSARNDERSHPAVVSSASPNRDKSSSETISPNHYQEQRHHHPRAQARPRSSSHLQSHYEDYDYDSYDDRDADEQGDENSSHHLGLLRVPCNIAINSDEASMGHHAQQDYPSQTKTPVAAYVDTGAQVTIISAAAAKRAGIYHLMDRRYAGRATGVGHCKVLGRIPARHVYFLLGEEERQSRDPRDDFEPCREDGFYGGDYRGGGGACGCDDDAGERDGGAVRMEGPALTVLEGTVTQGVDILFGLDVLEDWEASICMGPTKSLTIKKRRKGHNGVTGRSQYNSRARGSESVVIPFADARPPKTHREAAARCPPRSPPATRAPNARAFDDDLDDEDFSPTASDIESDLDLLDRSGHEFFPDEGRRPQRAGRAQTMQEMEDECSELRGGATRRPQARTAGRRREEEEDYDYFQEAEEEEEGTWDGQEELDLSGL